MAAAGLPLPRCQKRVLGRRRDFVWPDHRLIVETDGRRAHLNPVAFEADRRRDAETLTQGWRTLRFTRDAVFGDPGYVTATLRLPLSAAGTLA